MRQVANTAATYPSFCSMKGQEVVKLPHPPPHTHTDGMPVLSMCCLAQEHNTLSQPNLLPRPLDSESSALTLFTLTSVCIFSILFSIHFQGCRQGEFEKMCKKSRAL